MYICIYYRAVNNDLIDTYQLKSLDGLFGNKQVSNSMCIHYGTLCSESKLGLDNQAIVKEDNKLVLKLFPELRNIDQETLNKLRKSCAVSFKVCDTSSKLL